MRRSNAPGSANFQRFPGRSAGGFTLLEVLVALAVLGIAMAALIQAASQNTAHTHHLQERTLAHWVAANELARYRAGLVPLQSGSRQGRTELAGREWAWHAEVAPYSPQGMPEGLPDLPVAQRILRVEIRVFERPETEEYVAARLEALLSAPEEP